MKQRVDISGVSVVLTIILFGFLLGAAYIMYCQEAMASVYIMLGLAMVLALSVLFFAPMSVTADEQELCFASSFCYKCIPMKSIASVELYKPGNYIRICASGGFCGYWGYFREQGIGKYYGAYGKASECFLVRLKNGKQYVLGCKNHREMVEYIAKKIG